MRTATLAARPATAALQRATSVIPIVFVQVADPVGGGFVQNLAHPGGNITGFTNHEYAMVGKWLELWNCAKRLRPRFDVLRSFKTPTIRRLLDICVRLRQPPHRSGYD